MAKFFTTSKIERLLNVARALDESPVPKRKFTMQWFGKPRKLKSEPSCGTPACALGHYAARKDLQDVFRLRRPLHDSVLMLYSATDKRSAGLRQMLDYTGEEVCDHFGISVPEARRLFAPNGCGNAVTADAAAAYIRQFVTLKYEHRS